MSTLGRSVLTETKTVTVTDFSPIGDAEGVIVYADENGNKVSDVYQLAEGVEDTLELAKDKDYVVTATLTPAVDQAEQAFCTEVSHTGPETTSDVETNGQTGQAQQSGTEKQAA